MNNIIITLLVILFVICSKSWAISTCPGSPQNGGSVPGWNNCWGVYNHISGDVKGDRFYGLFINNAFVKGTYEYNSNTHGTNTGDIYIGEFYNNPADLSELKSHGQGIYYFNNGEIYDGEFYYGLFSGFGTYFYTQGDFAGTVYVGTYKDHKRSGFGTYYWGNDFGRIYMGQFSNDEANGTGLLIESEGKIWLGEFKDDNWVSGNEVTYNYNGAMPEPYPHFDGTKYNKKDNQEYHFAEKQNKNINPNEIINAASGSGFVVSKSGHIVTNNHVINGCNEIKVHYKGEQYKASILAKDDYNDLALLKAQFSPSSIFSIKSNNAELMEDIYVAGYPFGDFFNSSVKITKGIVSSLSGFQNNYSNMQIDAALQPGNSGGPVVDYKGNVVGVAVSKLDLTTMIEVFNSVPENTNFAIKSSVLTNFLSSNGVKVKKESEKDVSRSELSQNITESTLFLSCWMTHARIEEMKTQKVLFNKLID